MQRAPARCAGAGCRAPPARLSCSPACSPRPTQARQACSRRSRRSEKVRKGTISERDSVITWPSARPRSAAAWRAAARTKSGRPARSASPCSTSWYDGLVVQHVLREARGQLGQLLHHLRVARLRLGRAAGAGAHEVEVHALQQAPLLGRQAERSRCACSASMRCEQPGVHVDRAVVRGQRRRHLALHGLQLGRGLRRREVVEHRLDAREQPPAAVEGGDGVVEGGRLGLRGDGVQLVAVGAASPRAAPARNARRGWRRTAAGRRACPSPAAAGSGTGRD